MEDKIYDKFVEMSAERAKRRVVGDPFDPNTEQGPQVILITGKIIINARSIFVIRYVIIIDFLFHDLGFETCRNIVTV